MLATCLQSIININKYRATCRYITKQLFGHSILDFSIKFKCTTTLPNEVQIDFLFQEQLNSI